MPIGIMLIGIMIFLDRTEELGRLDSLSASPSGGLAVVFGRRRIGKTRLLVEWVRRRDGLYSVADLSSADIQRRYLAEAIGVRFPGFAEVEYRDWRSLFTRLGKEALRSGWRGPLVLDEFPYLVLVSPELPSVLQRFVDHEAKEARLVIAIAGSSQRMMQGLCLDSSAPLYGRAAAVLDVQPLALPYLRAALSLRDDRDVVEHFAAWGGVPRYLELAASEEGSASERVGKLVVDPLGPLHREPDRLLLEEIPSALEVRPVLDAIGSGAHRVSEIGARVGRPATSMARPLDRLVGMGLVRREVPFGDAERSGRRSLYRIDDPFFRLWFRVVAPHRGPIASATAAARARLLGKFWPSLVAESFEDLCRTRLPFVRDLDGGPYGAGARWWRGEEPEWDVVSVSQDGRSCLVGEAKWSEKPIRTSELERALAELRSRALPDVGAKWMRKRVVRALFVPEAAARGVRSAEAGDAVVVTASDLFR